MSSPNPVTAGTVLVLNSGSSSIKFQLIEPESGKSLAHGLIERIGEPEGRIVFHHTAGADERNDAIADHRTGLRAVLEMLEGLGRPLHEVGIVAVGHRLVHGGKVFYEPTLIDDDVVRAVDELSILAPLHNPANVVGMEVAREELPDIPHVGSSTPPSSTVFRRTRRPMRSTATSPTSTTSGGTDSTVLHTNTCRGVPRSSSDATSRT